MLGTGGLTRAYSKAASDAVNVANVITRTLGSVVLISLPYNLYGRVSPFIASANCATIDSDFGENINLTVFVPKDLVCNFMDKITDLTNGSAVITKKEDLFFDM